MPSLRSMRIGDLELVRLWLGEPHVARWYLSASTLEQELEDLRQSVVGDQPTSALIVVESEREIGWCQWYRCADYPEHAAGVGARPEDIGIDYAIGDPGSVGRGLGTALIAALVQHVRRRHPGCGVIADPEVGNTASRRILEKNGFVLLDERQVESEPTDAMMAIYRLAPGTVVSGATSADDGLAGAASGA
jgi:RimJ/RimL family protein N-acetyltransferase